VFLVKIDKTKHDKTLRLLIVMVEQLVLFNCAVSSTAFNMKTH